MSAEADLLFIQFHDLADKLEDDTREGFTLLREGHMTIAMVLMYNELIA